MTLKQLDFSHSVYEGIVPSNRDEAGITDPSLIQTGLIFARRHYGVPKYFLITESPESITHRTGRDGLYCAMSLGLNYERLPGNDNVMVMEQLFSLADSGVIDYDGDFRHRAHRLTLESGIGLQFEKTFEKTMGLSKNELVAILKNDYNVTGMYALQDSTNKLPHIIRCTAHTPSNTTTTLLDGLYTQTPIKPLQHFSLINDEPVLLDKLI